MSPNPIASDDGVRGALIGRGYTADVFAWGEGRVLKLFHPASPLERADREFQAAKAAYDAGLPAPAVHDLIEVDGRRGIVFERFDGRSMFDEIRRRPWRLFVAARELAEVHVAIHEGTAPKALPSIKDRVREWIAAADRPAADKRAALERLDTLPDGDAVCHGDFHPANVLRGPRGWAVIDWGGATRGPALADVAFTSRLFEIAVLPDWVPRPMHWLLACSRGLLHRTYLSHYFTRRPGSREELAAWKALIALKPVTIPEALRRGK